MAKSDCKNSGHDDGSEQANTKLLNRSQLNPYSPRYRFFKTILMCVAWISFGVNQELARITLEDLKILLDTNYQGVSFTILMRFVGAMVIVAFAGCVMDKFIKYTEFLMAFGKFLMAMPNLFIPHVRIYWLSTTLFLIQGIGIGIYEIGGNHIILRLWSGISNSPVNAMHSGYGIGAILIVQILKLYIKFDPFQKLITPRQLNSTGNYTSVRKEITSSDISLVVPYTFGGLVGMAIVVTFIIAQFVEWKALKKHRDQQSFKDQSVSLNDADLAEDYRVNTLLDSMQKIIFGKRFPDTTSFLVVTLLTTLVFLLFMCANGTITVAHTFMLTYLTSGPAKFQIKTFIRLQTFYWISFISGRLLAAFLGFKMNSLIFFLMLISTELVVTILYCVPYFNSNQTFYWFLIPILGTLLGPLIPSCFMVPKCLFKNLNAFLLSIFFIGIGVGNMVSQYITGLVLDKYNVNTNWLTYTNATSVYVIPYVLVALVTLSSIFYLLILVVYKSFKAKTVFL